MPNARAFLVRASILLLPALLIATAIPRMIDGIAVESAFPVPVYVTMNVAQSRKAYSDAAIALDQGIASDGDRMVVEAETVALAGGSRTQVMSLLDKGLGLSPASPRGWALRAEQLLKTDQKKAASSLEVAIMIAPTNYFLAGRLVSDAGALWYLLPDDTRRVATDLAPTLWNDPNLRPYIRPVLRTPGGVALMTEAFRLQPEDLRALNRWVAQERLEDGSIK